MVTTLPPSLQECCRALQPFIMGLLLDALWQGEGRSFNCFLCAALLSLTGILFLVSNTHLFLSSEVFAVKVKAGYSAAIYQKVRFFYNSFFYL